MVGCVNLHSHQTVQEGFLFSTPFSGFIVCRFFDGGHFDQCEVITHCGFELLFSNNVSCLLDVVLDALMSKISMSVHKIKLIFSKSWSLK